MHFLYNTGILLLGVGIRVYALFNEKTKRWVEGRKNWEAKLPKVNSDEVVWFHCASLGEFDQGLPLMWKFRHEKPDCCILVTFFSPSGMEHYHKRKHPADIVQYLPLDTPSNARKFVSHFNPKYFCLIKYEFWSNFIFEAKKQGAKVYNVSGIFRKNHRFFRPYGAFFRSTLRAFDWFFVQNEESVELLQSIGIENYSIVGDSRYDKVYQTRKNHIPNEIIANFCGDHRVFIVGSSWPKDEEIILPVINKLNCKVIIAPHNIDSKSIKGITSNLSRKFSRFTDGNVPESSEVLILDTIGHLSSAYSFGSIAYVGGGFTGNLHNILEPAVFGMGVMFGPKFEKYPEASSFIKNGFGFDVSTSDEVKYRIEYVLENREVINTKAAQFVEDSRGASEKMYTQITAN